MLPVAVNINCHAAWHKEICLRGAKRMVSTEVIAYPELGPETVRRLEVKNFPVMVIIDQEWNNLYETGKAQYRRF